MSKFIYCVVSNNTILGVEPLVETDTGFYCNNGYDVLDVVISKNAFPDANLLSVDVSDDFDLTTYYRYKCINSNLVSIEIPEQIKSRVQYVDERTQAVKSIRVTVNDKVFDGDEDSQTRMMRQIQVFDMNATDNVIWTLANNDNVLVYAYELRQALSLAVQEQSRLWPIPEEAV